MSDYRELILGSGHRGKSVPKVWFPSEHQEWSDVTTLDNNPDCKPDIVHDLNQLRWPLLDDWFDEIHASEVLEHIGRQGDAKSFFDTFSEIWRILKPGGFLVATVPYFKEVWAWGDPSHTRVINEGSLIFLSQAQYARQCDGPNKTSMSDFRRIYRADLEMIMARVNGMTFEFVLRAIKDAA